MMNETPVPRIAELLRGAGRAHHDAFAHVDGADPEWPLWYAEWLEPRIAALLPRPVTRSELTAALVLAEEQAEGVDDWAASYADFLLRRFSRS